MSDEDEFDKYDFSEFTEQDLREIDAQLARAHSNPSVQIAIQRDSPFNNFLSWKKYLAVTDIVSPIWCEVQYEYSLYGRRNKPLHLRPSTFSSKSGKQIHVHQQVAAANDRRLKRGKSVHKALEQELRPIKSLVHVTSDEERFGLRIIQLIDGFTQLMADGITRELPVFIITHGQVVLGVIDEVLYLPPPQALRDQAASSEPRSTSCGSPPHKKQRCISPSLAQPITPSSSTEHPTHVASTSSPTGPCELRIVDYKTRRSQNIPVDEDSLSPRLQLMMYHRMLSCLLEPEAFDFNLLWSRLSLAPTKTFSAQFLKDIVWEQRQVDSADCTVHLNRLVSEWISTVQRKRPEIHGVSQQLQLVYRRPVFAGAQQVKKATEPGDIEDPLEALLLQEEVDLARAIEESLGLMGHQDTGKVAHNVAQIIKQVGPVSIGRTSAVWKDLIAPESDQGDLTLAWAIHHSLLACARKACAEAPAMKAKENQDGLTPNEAKLAVSPSEVGVPDGIDDISPIIGTREFKMDDVELDKHIADVLQWWFGIRPPRGVNIGQTNRCFTCEFQDSCEWREKKAKETLALVAKRRPQRSTSVDSLDNIWPTVTQGPGTA